MKNFVSLITVLLVFTSISSLNAQNLRVAAASSETQQFYLAAKKHSQKIALLVPAVQKVRSSSMRRSLNAIVADSKKLANKVKASRGRISKTQYLQYKRQLGHLINQLKALGGSTTNGPAKCMKECDDAYPGLGGGKGWNRFWCKMSCLVIK